MRRTPARAARCCCWRSSGRIRPAPARHQGRRPAQARVPGDQPDGQGAGDPAWRRGRDRAGRGLPLSRRPLPAGRACARYRRTAARPLSALDGVLRRLLRARGGGQGAEARACAAFDEPLWQITRR